MQRCEWAKTEPMLSYHDEEWGVPVHDDCLHFELLILEGAQAGLSWETILKKRSEYRKAFAEFDPRKVARFDEAAAQELLANPGVVRNRLKIASAIENARAFLAVQKEHGSFDEYVWSFVGGKPIRHRCKSLRELPCESKESTALSNALRKRGFRFVGPTIMYAYMQATGLIDDHLVGCFRAQR
ncbi:MAG: DNA-3-methyladenine glycosylase I [Candidatus Wallbacteria bacterium]|nr:DNA-3-methyladenine glycosylase I [Candidatus Wallbacteria bacterium]